MTEAPPEPVGVASSDAPMTTNPAAPAALEQPFELEVPVGDLADKVKPGIKFAELDGLIQLSKQDAAAEQAQPPGQAPESGQADRPFPQVKAPRTLDKELAERLAEQEESFTDSMKVGGKRGKGTSLVDLETFELERELLEFAGQAQQKRRPGSGQEEGLKPGEKAPGKEDDKKDAKPAKPTRTAKTSHPASKKSVASPAAKGRGKKEVDKKAVRKIIKDLKKM